MKTRLLRSLSVASVAAILGGCNTAPTVRTVDPTSPDAISTVNRVDIQDWKRMANDMISSMLDNEAFARAPQQPPRVHVTRIVNNTLEKQDTALLTDEILATLTNSGIATSSATFGNNAADPEARQIKDDRSAAETLLKKSRGEYNAEDAIASSLDELPYFTLGGSLNQESIKQGRTRQSTFTLNLRLTRTDSGDVVWQDQRTLMKQTDKAMGGL